MSLIKIVCADQSHPNRVVTIADFLRKLDQGDRMPHEETPRPDDWGMSFGAENKHEAPAASLDAKSTVSGSAMGPNRYRLRCRLCGLTAVARKATLDPILTRAHAAGVSEIPLSAIVASL